MRFMAMVETGRPLPSATSARRGPSRGIPTVTDGPFIETKELIGGYAVSAPTRRRPGQAKRRFGRPSGATTSRVPTIDGERRRSIA